MQTTIEISLASLLAIFILFTEHWFPWSMIFGRELPRLLAYIIGLLALVLPLTALYSWWAIHQPIWGWAHLAALWAVVCAGGGAVLLAYATDWLLERIRRSYEQEQYF